MLEHRLDDDISLRLMEPRYAEVLYALTDRNRDHLRPWMSWIDATNSVEDTRNFIQAVVRAFAEGREFQLGIWERGELIGMVGMHLDDTDPKAEIGYWLDQGAEGRGIMTRAVRALLDYAFRELRLERVQIRAARENRRSRAIPERLGFIQEGTLRADLRVQGAMVDTVMYSMLAPEWFRTG